MCRLPFGFHRKQTDPNRSMFASAFLCLGPTFPPFCACIARTGRFPAQIFNQEETMHSQKPSNSVLDVLKLSGSAVRGGSPVPPYPPKPPVPPNCAASVVGRGGSPVPPYPPKPPVLRSLAARAVGMGGSLLPPYLSPPQPPFSLSTYLTA